MAVIEEKFNGKVSFWETRSHSRNDRFYTEKKLVEEPGKIDEDKDRAEDTGVQEKTATVCEEVETITPDLLVVDKASSPTEKVAAEKEVAETSSMHVNVEASVPNGAIEADETKLKDLANSEEGLKPNTKDQRIENEKGALRPNAPLSAPLPAPLPSPQDGRRKSRLGMRSQTMLGGLKRRMSFLGRDKS
jgi:hypothetical protein